LITTAQRNCGFKSLLPDRYNKYYPSGNVPRAYDIFRAYEGMEEETIKIKKLKIVKCNTKFKFN
jgi:hypothetical protein